MGTGDVGRVAVEHSFWTWSDASVLDRHLPGSGDQQLFHGLVRGQPPTVPSSVLDTQCDVKWRLRCQSQCGQCFPVLSLTPRIISADSILLR